MKLRKLPPLNGGVRDKEGMINPFHEDMERMGVKVGRNAMVMMTNHDTKECQRLVVIDLRSGKRLEVEFDTTPTDPVERPQPQVDLDDLGRTDSPRFIPVVRVPSETALPPEWSRRFGVCCICGQTVECVYTHGTWIMLQHAERGRLQTCRFSGPVIMA